MKSCVIALFVGGFFYSHQADAQSFGYSGRSGREGNSGRDGYSAAGRSVVIDGTHSGILDLRGGNAEEGQDGEEGESAGNCNQPQDTPYDLEGADGGGGGNGGEGGRGGNGGSLTLYTQDLTLLKSVSVYAQGGRGGDSGRGGRSGYGCRCSTRSWVVGEATYNCRDGHSGSDGRSPGTGSQGIIGSLTLIPQLSPLDPVNPIHKASLKAVLENDFTVSNYIWSSRSGAPALFAPGSRIADVYRYYSGRIDSEFRGEWKAERSLNDFAAVPVTLFLKDNYSTIEFPKDVWVLSNSTREGAHTNYLVQAALYEKEVTALSFQKVVGVGRELTAEFTDMSGYPELLNTEFQLSYYSKKGLFMHLRYRGKIDPSIIEVSGNHTLLHIGRLPISTDFLASGTKIRLEVQAKRNFAGRSLSLEYTRVLFIGN